MLTQAHGLAILRVAMGVFFLFEGLEKLPWLTEPELLTPRLARYAERATPLNQWYVELLRPGSEIFARLVVLGELAAGLALLTGVYTRLAAALALAMVLNFHFAGGEMFQTAFLRDGYGPPVIGALAALALAGKRLPWSLRG